MGYAANHQIGQKFNFHFRDISMFNQHATCGFPLIIFYIDLAQQIFKRTVYD